MNIGKATNIVNKILTNGGISIDHKEHEINGNAPGYAVSIYPDRGKVIDCTKFTPKDVVQFTWDNRDILAQPSSIFGAWVDKGKVYLDVSIVTKDVDNAKQLAKDNNQLAIFDFGTFSTIYI